MCLRHVYNSKQKGQKWHQVTYSASVVSDTSSGLAVIRQASVGPTGHGDFGLARLISEKSLRSKAEITGPHGDYHMVVIASPFKTTGRLSRDNE
ncbi:hypothetical protein EVAR_52667_1, partial [Eumeta japonica]